MQSLVERHWPESRRRNLSVTGKIGVLLTGLDDALREMPDGRGGVLADDPAVRRKALALKVRFEALEALEGRAPAVDEARQGESVAAIVSGILRSKLHRDLCNLVLDALGHYALPMPDERPGDNEEPVGGVYARSVRQGMLAGLFESPGTLDTRRDRLARHLLEARNISQPDTGN